MNQLIMAGCLLVAGLLAGWLISWLRHSKQLTTLITRNDLLEESNQGLLLRTEQQLQTINQKNQELLVLHGEHSASLEQIKQLDHWRQSHQQSQQELRHQLDINRIQESELREMIARLEESRLSAEDKQRLLINSEQRLSAQFENLANRIFEQTHQSIDKQNKQSLEHLLTPLREQLDGFRRHVNDSFSQEARERHTLTHEIKQLQQLNAQMAKEALNLTQALKGDNKIQGNWGEVVLTRILDMSGLRAGYEYETQVSLLGQNGRFQPDVVVRLPHKKDVVIDAKMTLLAYERYFNAEEKSEQQQALQEHIQAVRQHIRSLGNKDYQKLSGLRSLDYVLMFIPVEPAFLLALQHQPDLINEALQHNIMLVSPTTLLVALRTINNLWRYEQQSQNAQKIAERASRLYDKMRLFVDDMQNIGGYLNKATLSYHQAMKKLGQGRGNIIAQTEAFRDLGVIVKRPIDEKLLRQAVQDEDLAENAAVMTIEAEDDPHSTVQ